MQPTPRNESERTESEARTTGWFSAVEDARIQYSVLVAVTLLAAGLRFYKLGEWSFWIDELFFIRRSQAFSTILAMFGRFEPISILLTRLVIDNTAVTEWSARLAPALIGILSIPILYFPTRRMFGPRVALIAALLLAVSPWHLTWSQNARFYTTLMLLYALASMAFFFAIERGRSLYIVLFYVLLLLSFRERPLAVVLVPVAFSYLLLLKFLPFERPKGFGRRPVIVFLFLGIGLGLLDLVGFITSGYSEIAGGLTLPYDRPVLDSWRLGTFTAFDIGIPLIALGLFGGAYSISQRSRAGTFLLVSAVVPVALLLLVNLFYFTKPRYAFVTLPSWILLGAIAIQHIVGLARGRQKLLAAGVFVAIVADAAAANLLYFQANHGNRLEWKQAFAIAQDRSQEGDVFVAWWPEFGPYYLGQEVTAWPELTPSMVLASHRRHWFVLDSETVWGNLAMKSWVEQNAELIDVRYLRTPDDAYLRVYFFDPRRIPSDE